MTSGAASPGGRRAGRLPAEDPTWWFAAIWLVFLIMPAGALLDSPAGPAARSVAALALLAFMGVYVLAFRNPGLVPPHRAPWLPVVWCLALAALALLTVPAVGLWAFGTVPYLLALLAFQLPLRPALAVLAVLLVVVAAAVLAGLLPPGGQWVLPMHLTSTVVIGGMRLAAHRDEQHLALSSELALVRERERVARDVHDILGHSLTVITLKAELAQRLLDREPDRARAELDDVLRLSRDSLAEVRATVGRLRAPDFAEQLAASRTALAAAGIEADLDGTAEEVTGPRRPVFAWALREAVTNVVRHSCATRCTVRWSPTRLTVADDGDGLLGPEGNGLRGLRERVARAGGTVAVRPGPEGTGTVVEVVLP
ncbi:sensor histidine kinase [Kocuria sp. M1R5S2]|uniref:sensor histidine kinase n=1 Tax=Kocuria rhizosphaerae TaxID=3376285 RepID=UPI00379017F1